MPLRATSALSVRQPWAGLLLEGVKKFEVRSWSPGDTKYVFLHASAARAPGLADERSNPLYRRALHVADMEDQSGWVLGAFIGVVEVERIWKPGHHPRSLSKLNEYLCGPRRGMFLWEIGRRWELATPIACKGKLNLWEPPSVIRRRLERAKFRVM